MSASAKDWKSLAEDEKCPQALETCAVSACGGFSVSGTEFHSLVAFAKDWKSLSEGEKCPQALGLVRLAPEEAFQFETANFIRWSRSPRIGNPYLKLRSALRHWNLCG